MTDRILYQILTVFNGSITAPTRAELDASNFSSQGIVVPVYASDAYIIDYITINGIVAVIYGDPSYYPLPHSIISIPNGGGSVKNVKNPVTLQIFPKQDPLINHNGTYSKSTITVAKFFSD